MQIQRGNVVFDCSIQTKSSILGNLFSYVCEQSFKGLPPSCTSEMSGSVIGRAEWNE